MCWRNYCRKGDTVLIWGKTTRYFKNTNFQWSPWLSKITEGYLDEYWREVAWKVNNKGLRIIGHLWDPQKLCWKEVDELTNQFYLSSFERILVCRVLESLISVIGPLGEPVIDWKAWHWPIERSFEAPNLKLIYSKLMYRKDWFAHLNKIWGRTWSERSWAGKVERIWS